MTLLEKKGKEGDKVIALCNYTTSYGDRIKKGEIQTIEYWWQDETFAVKKYGCILCKKYWTLFEELNYEIY